MIGLIIIIICFFILLTYCIVLWVKAIDNAIDSEEWKYYGDYKTYGFNSYDEDRAQEEYIRSWKARQIAKKQKIVTSKEEQGR